MTKSVEMMLGVLSRNSCSVQSCLYITNMCSGRGQKIKLRFPLVHGISHRVMNLFTKNGQSCV